MDGNREMRESCGWHSRLQAPCFLKARPIPESHWRFGEQRFIDFPMKYLITISALIAACAVSVQAKIVTQSIEYKQGDTTLEGYRTEITQEQLQNAPEFSRDQNYDRSSQQSRGDLRHYYEVPIAGLRPYRAGQLRG